MECLEVWSRSRRWMLLSVLIALWCIAWPIAMLELTRGYPGILSFKGHRGAYELIDVSTRVRAWMVLLGWFLMVLLLGWLVGVSRRWLDPQRMSTQSVIWAFSSRSLNVGAIAMATAFIAIPVAAQYFRSDGLVGIAGFLGMFVFLVAAATAPFFSWNPRTLDGDRIGRWWMPGWPGWKAIASVLALLLLMMAWQFVLAEIPDPVTARMAAFPVNSVLDFLFWVLIAMVWLDAGSFDRLRRDLGVVRRKSVFRQFVWLFLLDGLVFLCVLIPVMSVSIMAIFIVPQYSEWARGNRQPLLDSLRWIATVARLALGGYWMGPASVFAIYPLLILGRLLRCNGVGDPLALMP